MTERWDNFFMGLAEHCATMSKDSSSQVGAVIVRDRDVLALGWNGIPRGVRDDWWADDRIEMRNVRPGKYMWYEHAERNAIYNAGRSGVALLGATVYVTKGHPCADCARAIIQAGIGEVVIPAVRDSAFDKRWGTSIGAAGVMFNEADVVVRSV